MTSGERSQWGEHPASLAAAADLVSAAQRAFRSAIEPGVTELELWAGLCDQLGLASSRFELLIDFVSGPRAERVGGPPTTRVVRAGDPIIFDLALSVDGAWADSCTTLCCGTPTAELRVAHAATVRALEAGIAAARPGMTGDELDQVIRGVVAQSGGSYAHHSGHALGRAAQQPPWIRPGSTDVLREGDVIALEPGMYGPGFGVRVEHLVLVAVGGAVPLTAFDLSLH